MTVLKHTLACVIPLAVALPAAAEERAIEEIVVTAQKRAQSSNDIGMAISAFTGEGLEEIGVLTAEDIALQTPGLSVGDGGGLGVPIYTIRGIGFDSININASSTVGVYVDEVAVPYPIMTTGQLFDIERVEVLKGPQGDLYGRNTTGGAISFFSRRPTETLEAGINVDYGSYDYTRIDGFVSGPITDNLRGRLAAVKTDQDGWQDVYSLDETFAPFKAADNGKLDQLSVRGTLDWDLSDIASVSVGAYHSRDKSDEVALKNVGENVGLNYYADDPDNPTVIYYLVRHTADEAAESLATGSYLGIPLDPTAPVLAMTQDGNQDDMETVYLSTRPTRNNKSDGASLKVDVDFENFTLTSISGYDRFKRERTIDWDASWLRIADNFSDAEIESFSQELRLTSAGEGAFTWIAGLYYSDDTVEENYITSALDSAIAGFDVGTGYQQDTETIAVFGHTEWQLNDLFRLTLGLRYTDEERSIDNLGTVLVNDPYGVFGGAPNGFILTDLGGPLFSDSIDTQKVSGRVVLDYTPNDTMLFYGSVSTGFKSGGFNAENAITSAQYEPYGPEEVVAYELGFKLSLLERTMQLNGATFYYDYTDKQTVDFIPTAFGPLGVLANVDESEVTGMELDLRWSPLTGLDITAGVSYLDSKVEKYVGFYGSRAGFELPNTPEWSYNAVVSYEFPVVDGIYLRTLANYTWVDSSRSALEDADYFVTDSYGVLGARIALVAADGRWEAALWGRNIGDEAYFVYNGFVSEALHAQPAMPATYGLSVSYNYF